MRKISNHGSEIQAVEELMLDKFRTEPFHNLFLLNKITPYKHYAGGTCSDKTLSFIAAARAAGHNASLHTAFIGGREIHRLARILIGEQLYFADVGNGWPALKLYPADTPMHATFFGMGFRTEINEGRIRVYHRKRSQEVLQLEIDTKIRPEADITSEINARFNSNITYPFSHSTRFSAIVDEKFLFLRGESLETYGRSGLESTLSVRDTATALADHFHVDANHLLNVEALDNGDC